MSRCCDLHSKVQTLYFVTMIFLYNIITLLLAPFILLLLPVYLLFNPEKFTIIPLRFGFKLKLPSKRKQSTLWIHALSVGEITSAHHLVKQIHRERHTSTTIIFSTTTGSGHQLARRLIAPFCDALIYYPVDILPVVKYFHRKIQPDLFILVETDFWPNMLYNLASYKVPMLLLNGRVSDRSMHRYKRFETFFAPLFNTFRLLCMQTDNDADKMRLLGVSGEKIKTVGNLKFGGCDEIESVTQINKNPFPDKNLVVFAGSTHQGEDEIIIEVFVQLRKTAGFPLHLVIAPRKVSRCQNLVELLQHKELSFVKYSAPEPHTGEVTIIDTIGDLAALYRFADISFIGGSLVAEGGHNPLEAAQYGCPVLFGPYMDDFSEISLELQECGGALMVKDQATLGNTLETLIHNDDKRKSIGQNALGYTTKHAHVIDDHLRLIDRYL